MKSPFPGHDPYLEDFWSDVHASMMHVIRAQLQTQLPDGLWSRIEQGIHIDDDGEKPRWIFPDVLISEDQSWRPTWNEDVGGLAVAEPIVITTDDIPPPRHIEIVDTRSGDEVVTAIEVLSPGNKIGNESRSAYREKQRNYIRGRVSLVEIDLIRTGEYILSAPQPPDPIPKREGCEVCVYRANIPLPEWEVYPILLREKLPAFRIPLRPGDSDIALDLQAVLDRCYDEGAYDRGIDYSAQPKPALSDADWEWAKSLLGEG
ncbi:MAG: hypothetical protein ACI8UO_001858 [Verrucomicrobiales bacterium]|jgi:hypothetical protein